MALYDVMGKYLELPAYRLMGQKCRDAVSLAAWTRPCSPAELADEVRHAAAAGYTILKMHSSPLWDVLEHARRAAAAAPPGFRLHFDFNGGALNSRRPRTVATVLPLLRELERLEAVGFIEDVVSRHDVHGWRNLRERTHIPLILGHDGTLGTALDATLGMADIYMLSGNGVGRTLARGSALSVANHRPTALLSRYSATVGSDAGPEASRSRPPALTNRGFPCRQPSRAFCGTCGSSGTHRR